MERDIGTAAIAYPFIASAQRPTVFVIDGDRAARHRLETLLARHGWYTRSFDSAVEFLAQTQTWPIGPACLIVEADLPGMSGYELQQRIGTQRALPVIFTARHASVRAAVRAMKAGAVEFVTKPLDEDLLLAAVRQALQQSRMALEEQTRLRLLHDRFDLLSDRERDVMRLVVAGRLNKQAADELGISEITVKTHRGKVMRKMRAASLPDLVIMAAALRDRAGHGDGYDNRNRLQQPA